MVDALGVYVCGKTMEAPLAAQFDQERTATEQLQLAAAACPSPPQQPASAHQPQSDPNDTPDSAKAPRRRNKPSLSCQACTNKKTKVRALPDPGTSLY